MVIDVDRCTGCGSCMVACAVENNIPAADPSATDRTGLTWMKVYRAAPAKPAAVTGPVADLAAARAPAVVGPVADRASAGGGRAGSISERGSREVFFPVPCQHCDHETPCESVCPQLAVELDPQTGIVTQIPSRCLGCRYCMAACPYHARYFNWWDPVQPEGLDGSLNPDVSPRMRGVVEKCNFCHGRLQAARSLAALEGRKTLRSGDYVPACAEACPAQAISFGDLRDETSEVARSAKDPRAFRLLERLGTDPKVYYHSSRPWVRALGQSVFERSSAPLEFVDAGAPPPSEPLSQEAGRA
jgi:molybdopterin-containing oxidoreductase family iron-sulfur binding subunit